MMFEVIHHYDDERSRQRATRETVWRITTDRQLNHLVKVEVRKESDSVHSWARLSRLEGPVMFTLSPGTVFGQETWESENDLLDSFVWLIQRPGGGRRRLDPIVYAAALEDYRRILPDHHPNAV